MNIRRDQSSSRWGARLGAVNVVMASLTFARLVHSADLPGVAAPRHLPRAATAQEVSEGTDHQASFRLTDQLAEAEPPHAPGPLLSELADAALPAESSRTRQSDTAPSDAMPSDAVGGKLDSPRHLPYLADTLSPVEDTLAAEGGGLNVEDRHAVESPASVSGPPASATPEATLAAPHGLSADRCDTSSCEWPSGTAANRLFGDRHLGHAGWFRNSSIFLAGDGWKNIFDDDDNNNFGFRTGFTMGIDLPTERSLQGQFGASYGAYDFHGREQLLSEDDPIEQQVFGTIGLFKRSQVQHDDRLAWGAVCDVMVSEHAGERSDDLRLAQLRGRLGYALNGRNEIGSWMAFRLLSDYAEGQRVTVRATDQAHLFWKRTWQRGGDTMAYVGWADDPGDVVVGLNGRVPLNQRAALFGRVHYVIPSTSGGDVHPELGTDDVFSQEAWAVSFGIVFYRGQKAISPNVSGRLGLPLLPVADNGTFSFQADML